MNYNLVKRTFDLIFSLSFLIILFPILFLVILLLMITGEGEVFYLQERIGKDSKPFKIWKFATMKKNSSTIGSGDVTLRHDPRVLPFGKFLRICKINELPQLINILIGQMSFVGPRPLMKAGFDRYHPDIKNKIYKIKPGLTGIGSIVFRDEEKILTNSNLTPHECYKKIILPHKGTLELWYQKNFNFCLDFQLIFLTAWVIVFPNSKFYYKILKNIPKRNF